MTTTTLCRVRWTISFSLCTISSWAQTPQIDAFFTENRRKGETWEIAAQFSVSGAAEYTLSARCNDPFVKILSPPRVLNRQTDSTTVYLLPSSNLPFDHTVRIDFVFSDGKNEAVRSVPLVFRPTDGRIAARDFALDVRADGRWERLHYGKKTYPLHASGFMTFDGTVNDAFFPMSECQIGSGWGDTELSSIFANGIRTFRQTFLTWTCDDYIIVEYEAPGGLYWDAGMNEGRFRNGTMFFYDGEIYVGVAALWGEGRGGVMRAGDKTSCFFASDTLVVGGAAGSMWAEAFAVAAGRTENELFERLAAARFRYGCQYPQTMGFAETQSSVDETPQFGGGCTDKFVAVEIPIQSTAAGTARVEVCGGTARVPADAVLPQTSVVFDGPGIRHLVVYVRDDAALETAETLELCLMAECDGPVKACSFSKHVLTIYDNDRPPVALPVQEAVAETKEYLGPRETVVFYAPGHRSLMAKIENLSEFDYGCTALSIDRSGRGAQAFQNADFGSFAAEKTFYIRPEHSHPYGRFRLTLYYTVEEIAGWRAATGGQIEHLNMFKSDRPIAGVTPSTPNVNGAYGENQRVEYFGVNYAVSAEFATGFSGFGIGKNGWDGPLPVRIFDFWAHAENGGVKLAWKTGVETNVARYVVERSTGGKFEDVATIAAAGAYEYRHWDWNVPTQTLYYRIRTEDFDGTAGFSQTREVRPPDGNWAVSFHPNPTAGTGQITLHPPNIESPYSVSWRLLRADGGRVAEGRIESQGIAVFPLEVAESLAPGVYLLQFPSLPIPNVKIVKF